MKKLVKITAAFNHRLEDYVLSVVKSKEGSILDHKQYYELKWVYGNGNLISDSFSKDDLNKIKQEHATWRFILITTDKNYNSFKKEILEKIMEVAKNKLVDCHKNTFIELDSFCKEN